MWTQLTLPFSITIQTKPYIVGRSVSLWPFLFFAQWALYPCLPSTDYHLFFLLPLFIWPCSSLLPSSHLAMKPSQVTLLCKPLPPFLKHPCTFKACHAISNFTEHYLWFMDFNISKLGTWGWGVSSVDKSACSMQVYGPGFQHLAPT